MKRISSAYHFLWVGFTLVLVTGCSQQKMGVHDVSSTPEHEMKCQLCYDEVQRVLVGTSKVYKSRGHKIYKEIKIHKCSGCDSQATIYEQDGVLMVKCPECVPEGVPCDKCAPTKQKS